jgi:hypothetical protein
MKYGWVNTLLDDLKRSGVERLVSETVDHPADVPNLICL